MPGVKAEGQSPAVHENLRERWAFLEEQDASWLSFGVEQVAEAMRAEAEEKPISLKVSLRAALRRIPFPWLNAAAATHGAQPARLRRDRERALAEMLTDPAVLRRALSRESPEVRAALRFLLEGRVGQGAGAHPAIRRHGRRRVLLG